MNTRTKPRHEKVQRGPKPRGEWEERVRELLRIRDDPIALSRTAFAKTKLVEAIVEQRYTRRVCASGIASREIIKECLREMAEDLEGMEPMVTVIKLTLEGRPQVEIARRLGFSPEYLSRSYKRMLIELFLEKLQSRMREAQSAS